MKRTITAISYFCLNLNGPKDQIIVSIIMCSNGFKNVLLYKSRENLQIQSVLWKVKEITNAYNTNCDYAVEEVTIGALCFDKDFFSDINSHGHSNKRTR